MHDSTISKSSSMLQLLRSSVPVPLTSLKGSITQRNKSIDGACLLASKHNLLKRKNINQDILEVSDSDCGGPAHSRHISPLVAKQQKKHNFDMSRNSKLNSLASLESMLKQSFN
jgi:hypothetical protein